MTSVGDTEVDSKVAEWLKWDQNERTRKEILDLVASKNVAELRSRMIGRLAFGTAGIRAPMEAGFNRLNDLVVIQVTQGMIAHMKSEFPDNSKGIAIGFDGRHNSQRFARLAANAFVLSGIKVYFFKEVAPTPLVSYATIRLNCDAGLMITASHNPKADNGYKAYWSNGAQILSPHDTTICELMLHHQEPMKNVWDINALENHPLFHDAHDVIDLYFADAAKFNYFKDINAQCSIKFAYSAFHGVGLKFTPRCLEEFGFKKSNIVLVEEQAQPDPDFPTVPFPNPEEGRQVLELSMQTADRNGCKIILANDPDADRFQIAEKQSNGDWRIFTGNEMGAVLSWWVWKGWRKANPNAKTDNIYFLNSAVSSQIVKTMGAREGFNNRETLTGFKWMGNLAQELRQKGQLVLLAWEESIGFMPGDTLDKDGVLAAAMFAECCAFLAVEGLSLTDQLLRIYKEYGFHLTRNSYFVNRDPAITTQLFANIRQFGGTQTYPSHIGKNSVKSVRDLTVGFDSEQTDKKPVLPVSRSSEMITFTLGDGSVVTLRASGTEPKIKYYIELKTEPGKDAGDLDNVIAELDQLEADVVATLLQPEKYFLEARH